MKKNTRKILASVATIMASSLAVAAVAVPTVTHSTSNVSSANSVSLKTTSFQSATVASTDANVVTNSGSGFDAYIPSVPQVYIISNTNQMISYGVKNFSVSASCPYYYDISWAISTTNGRVWNNVPVTDRSNLNFNVVKPTSVKLLIKLVITFWVPSGTHWTYPTYETNSFSPSDVGLIVDKDAVAATTDTFSASISSSEVTGNESFNSKLNSLFAANGNSYLAGTYKNVSIAYVNNSANYNNSTFKINVTPLTGHAWADGTQTAKTVTVTATNLSKSFQNPVASASLGYVKYVTSIPSVYIISNTNESVMYQASGLRYSADSPYAVRFYWQVSLDNGKTFTEVENSNLVNTLKVNKIPGKQIYIKYTVAFSIEGAHILTINTPPIAVLGQ